MSRKGEQNPTQFKPGQSGNPDGQPKGSRNATTIALEKLLDGQATALTQKAIDLALAGDMAALRLCLDRILPPRKDRPVTFVLPPIEKCPGRRRDRFRCARCDRCRSHRQDTPRGMPKDQRVHDDVDEAPAKISETFIVTMPGTGRATRKS